MKPETAKQLEAILDGRQKQEQATAQRVDTQKQAEARNLADFSTKKEQVIKPALQELVDLYKARGISIRIEEEDERQNEKGGTQSRT
jgi:hypothetical protein